MDDAATNQPTCSFELEVHELIFHRKNVPIRRYPLLLRMQDYFADTCYFVHELPELVQQIKALIALLPPRNPIVTTLQQFHQACSDAIAVETNIYLICD